MRVTFGWNVIERKMDCTNCRGVTRRQVPEEALFVEEKEKLQRCIRKSVSRDLVSEAYRQ